MPSPKINYHWTTLTIGEKLWLRRRRAGRTQREEAHRLGINHAYYGDMELDRREAPDRVRLSLPHIFPTLTERLILARRRAGALLEWVAAQNGVSRVTILVWERAGEDRLVTFWMRRGFSP